jgi:hypothetical protein
MNRRIVLWAALSGVLALGCEGASGDLPDGGDAGACILVDGGPPCPNGPTVVSVEVSPGYDGARTNGSNFFIGAAVDGGTPSSVGFWIDDAEVFTTSGPPDPVNGYVYQWKPDSSVADGEHSLQATAIVDGGTYSSPRHTFVLDRTPPQLVSTHPDAGASVCLTDTFTFQFSEPLLARPDSGVACLPGPCHYDPMITFALDDGGVVDATTVFAGDFRSVVANLRASDGGAPEPGYVGMLTANSTDLLEDLVDNPVVPFQVQWQVGASCTR